MFVHPYFFAHHLLPLCFLLLLPNHLPAQVVLDILLFSTIVTWWTLFFFFSFWLYDLKWISPQFCFSTLPSILPVLDNFCIIDESSWGKVPLRYKSKTLLRIWYLFRFQRKMSGSAMERHSNAEISYFQFLMLSNCSIYACWQKTHSDILMSLYQTWH